MSAAEEVLWVNEVVCSEGGVVGLVGIMGLGLNGLGVMWLKKGEKGFGLVIVGFVGLRGQGLV